VNFNSPFPKGPSRYYVVGTTNSGKTTLACRMIKQMLHSKSDPRQQLIIISPNYHRDPQLLDLAKMAAIMKLSVIVYLRLDKVTMAKFVEHMDQSCLNNIRSTVFIDDPVGVGSFTSNVNQASPFNSFVTSLKHYKTDMVFCSQNIGGMSASARKNIEVFVFLPDMVSRVDLFKACRIVPTQAEFDKLMDTHTQQQHSALWINVQYGRKGVYGIDAGGNISAITRVV
jgi:hypothetical protein